MQEDEAQKMARLKPNENSVGYDGRPFEIDKSVTKVTGVKQKLPSVKMFLQLMLYKHVLILILI